MRMSVIYPYKWSGQFPNSEAVLIAKEEWQEGLEDLTLEQIKKGLRECKKSESEFLPSIPEFRKLCLPTKQEMGILEEEDAYYQFCKHDYSNPLVNQTYLQLDMFAWVQMERKEARKAFFNVYNIFVERYIENFQQEKIQMAALTNQTKKEVLQLEQKETDGLQFTIIAKQEVQNGN